MTLAPLFAAPAAVQFHAWAAMAALVLGIAQFTAPKGTLPHRTVGWIWVVLMLIVAVSAFFIHNIRLVGPWSPIHLIAIFVLVMVPLGVLRARRHNVSAHRKTMMGVFIGGLIIAGLFTLLPGRIMNAVLLGG